MKNNDYDRYNLTANLSMHPSQKVKIDFGASMSYQYSKSPALNSLDPFQYAYFANPYDHNYLYVMDSDCSNARMLNSDSVASLNIYNDKIYYVKNNFPKEMIGTILRGQLFGIYQTDLEGQNSTMLYNHLTGSVSLCGNYLYYLTL